MELLDCLLPLGNLTRQPVGSFVRLLLQSLTELSLSCRYVRTSIRMCRIEALADVS